MWHGVGFLAGILALALIVWEGISFANIDLAVPVTPSMVTAFLAILTLVFTFIRLIEHAREACPGTSLSVGRSGPGSGSCLRS